MSRRQQQSQHTNASLPHREIQLPQKSEAEERRQHSHKNVGGVTDDDVSHRGIGAIVVCERGQARDVGPCNVTWQHQERLPHSIPALQRTIAPVHAELGILVGKYWRLRGPESVSRLLAMLGVGGTELARLHHECDQARGQRQQKNGIAQAVSTRMDGHRCSSS
jgi:hypothetical protein